MKYSHDLKKVSQFEWKAPKYLSLWCGCAWLCSKTASCLPAGLQLVKLLQLTRMFLRRQTEWRKDGGRWGGRDGLSGDELTLFCHVPGCMFSAVTHLYQHLHQHQQPPGGAGGRAGAAQAGEEGRAPGGGAVWEVAPLFVSRVPVPAAAASERVTVAVFCFVFLYVIDVIMSPQELAGGVGGQRLQQQYGLHRRLLRGPVRGGRLRRQRRALWPDDRQTLHREGNPVPRNECDSTKKTKSRRTGFVLCLLLFSFFLFFVLFFSILFLIPDGPMFCDWHFNIFAPCLLTGNCTPATLFNLSQLVHCGCLWPNTTKYSKVFTCTQHVICFSCGIPPWWPECSALFCLYVWKKEKRGIFETAFTKKWIKIKVKRKHFFKQHFRLILSWQQLYRCIFLYYVLLGKYFFGCSTSTSTSIFFKWALSKLF